MSENQYLLSVGINLIDSREEVEYCEELLRKTLAGLYPHAAVQARIRPVTNNRVSLTTIPLHQILEKAGEIALEPGDLELINEYIKGAHPKRRGYSPEKPLPGTTAYSNEVRCIRIENALGRLQRFCQSIRLVYADQSLLVDDEKIPVVMQLPIEALGFSTRTHNLFGLCRTSSDISIRLIQDLLNKSFRELEYTKGFGRKTLAEIETILSFYGLKLKDG